MRTHVNTDEDDSDNDGSLAGQPLLGTAYQGPSEYNRIFHNNQSDVFIYSAPLAGQPNHFFLATRSRVFWFNATREHIPSTLNTLLELQTSSKYRLLSSLSATWVALDRIIYLYLVMTALIHLIQKAELPDGSTVSQLSSGYMTLLAMVVIEMMFTVLMSSTMVWAIERLSPYVSVVILLGYTGTVFGWTLGCDDPVKAPECLMFPTFDYVLLSIRTINLFFEYTLQYAFDLEIERDLVVPPPKNSRADTSSWRWFSEPFTIHPDLDSRLQIVRRTYINSISMWFFGPALNVPQRGKPSYYHRIIFFVAAFPLVPLLLFFLLLLAFLHCLGTIFTECRNAQPHLEDEGNNVILV